jgi:hypothetical protein
MDDIPVFDIQLTRLSTDGAILVARAGKCPYLVS